MSTRQLAERVGVDQSNITRLEEREPSGHITLERLARVAKAMNCRLVYAIVPDDRFSEPQASSTSVLEFSRNRSFEGPNTRCD